MTQHDYFVFKMLLAILVMSLLPTRVRANWDQDYQVCIQTPDSAAKHRCVQKLLPRVKHLFFDSQRADLVDRLIEWDNYLGIQDADYQKAVAMKPVLARASQIYAENAGDKNYYGGFTAMAGYYDSLGPEWKKWGDRARQNANLCTRYGCDPESPAK
jgi:hypothetical protein